MWSNVASLPVDVVSSHHENENENEVLLVSGSRRKRPPEDKDGEGLPVVTTGAATKTINIPQQRRVTRARMRHGVQSFIKQENIQEGDIQCPVCYQVICIADKGCNIVTCRNHQPEYIFFCIHCKKVNDTNTEYSNCTCPKRNTRVTRAQAQIKRNQLAKACPIEILDDDSDNNSEEEVRISTPMNRRQNTNLATSSTIRGTNVVPSQPPQITDASAGNALFTKEAFMSKNIFHINPFIDAATKRNRAFGPFVAGRAATIGFNTRDYLDLKSDGLNYPEIRQTLIGSGFNSSSDLSQMHIFLAELTVGDFILMRHEYPKCPYTPQRLLDKDGKYIGPIYVLGVVTALPAPPGHSHHEMIKRVGERNGEWGVYELQHLTDYCGVEFLRMGKKNNLDHRTNQYIGKVCQKTISKICNPGKTFPKLDTNSEDVRLDLWVNATCPIMGDDFAD